MKKSTIIIIDDSPVMSRFLSIFLEKKYNVISFSDPIEALTEFKNGLSPSVIITDLDMPHLSGLDFIKHIRTSGDKTPILVVSSNKESNTRVHCLEVGADDYLTKPFHPAELEMRTSKLMARTPNSMLTTVEDATPIRSIFKEFIKAAAF